MSLQMFTSNRNSNNFNTDLAYMSLPHIYVILRLWPCSFKFVLSISINTYSMSYNCLHNWKFNGLMVLVCLTTTSLLYIQLDISMKKEIRLDKTFSWLPVSWLYSFHVFHCTLYLKARSRKCIQVSVFQEAKRKLCWQTQK